MYNKLFCEILVLKMSFLLLPKICDKRFSYVNESDKAIAEKASFALLEVELSFLAKLKLLALSGNLIPLKNVNRLFANRTSMIRLTYHWKRLPALVLVWTI